MSVHELEARARKVHRLVDLLARQGRSLEFADRIDALLEARNGAWDGWFRQTERLAGIHSASTETWRNVASVLRETSTGDVFDRL